MQNKYRISRTNALLFLFLAFYPGIIFSQTFIQTEVTTSGDGFGVDSILSNNNIYFSHFSVTGDLRFTENIDGTWTSVNVQTNTTGSLEAEVESSLLFDSSNEPHIFYYHRTNQSLQHASRTGNSWNVEVIDSTNNVGGFSAAIHCQSNKFCICYKDLTNGNLMFAIGTAGDWSIETADSSVNDVGGMCSLVEASNGSIYVAHHDSTAKKLSLSTRSSLGVWSSEIVPSGASEIGFWPAIALTPEGEVVIYSSSYKTSDTGVADESAWYSSKSNEGAWSSGANEAPYYGGHPHIYYNDRGEERTVYRYLRYSGLFGNFGSIRFIQETSGGTMYSTLGSDPSCFPRYKFLHFNEDSSGNFYVTGSKITSGICNQGLFMFTALAPTPTPTPTSTLTPTPISTPSPTSTPISTPTNTSTATSIPLSSATPTHTVTPSPGPTDPSPESTPTPIVQPSPTATKLPYQCSISAKKIVGKKFALQSKLKLDGKSISNAPTELYKSTKGSAFKKVRIGKTTKKGVWKTFQTIKTTTEYKASFPGFCETKVKKIKVRK